MPQWEFPKAASSLVYAAKFTAEDDALSHALEAGAEALEAGPEAAGSAALAALAEGGTGSMDLWFQNGRVYTFFAVPYAVFEELLQASSPGGYYNQYIRGRYSG